jgi:hypothetical protein
MAPATYKLILTRTLQLASTGGAAAARLAGIQLAKDANGLIIII